MNKPVFKVIPTPVRVSKDMPAFLPENFLTKFCACINVADERAFTFVYQKAGIPSFWFPINEVADWGYEPFFAAYRVMQEYYDGSKSIVIHCHAGANRSPSVAYAILRSLGRTESEAEAELNYPDFELIFQRNLKRGNIPSNIIEFLQMCGKNPEGTINTILSRMDCLYAATIREKFDTLRNSDNIKFDSNTKRFVVAKK